MHLIMSIKTFRRIVFGITFEHAFENDSLGRIGDMFGGGEHFDAVIFEGAFVNCGFVFVAGKAIELIDCHIFSWTLILCDFLRNINDLMPKGLRSKRRLLPRSFMFEKGQSVKLLCVRLKKFYFVVIYKSN